MTVNRGNNNIVVWYNFICILHSTFFATQFCIGMYIFSIVLFTVTSLNYVTRPPGPSDPNLDQNYDIFVGTILAFNANVCTPPTVSSPKFGKILQLR